MGGDTDHLPPAFVHALEMSAIDHMRMIAAVQPYIDAAVSKTVNVPEDYPFDHFKQLYFAAWKEGLKGITTYRPNNVIGSVLEVRTDGPAATEPQDLKDDPDRRVQLTSTPQPALASLKWPGRPGWPKATWPGPTWSRSRSGTSRSPSSSARPARRRIPFEVWVNGAEQPRGLGAIAKTLSMDMRSEDRAWLKMKLDALAKARDEDGFTLAMPPQGKPEWQSGVVAAFANIVRLRCEQLGTFRDLEQAPHPGGRRAVLEEGTEGRAARHHELDRRHRATPTPATISSSASRNCTCPTAAAGPTRSGSPANTRRCSTACAS
jgi:ribonucleoside-diphosphate reductase alpha chain